MELPPFMLPIKKQNKQKHQIISSLCFVKYPPNQGILIVILINSNTINNSNSNSINSNTNNNKCSLVTS